MSRGLGDVYKRQTLDELPADRRTAAALGELVAGRIDAALLKMRDQH